MKVIARGPDSPPSGVIVERDGVCFRWHDADREWLPAPAGAAPAIIKWGWRETTEDEQAPAAYPDIPFDKVPERR